MMTKSRAHQGMDVIVREQRVRRLALALAGKTGLDPRTCRGALERGAVALRSVADQALITEAADELEISLPLEV